MGRHLLGPPSRPEDEGKGSNREARYRRQLRDTETERDQLRGRVDTMQRAEVERLASTRLSRPAAVWANGADLADLLDAEGHVDPEAVQAAAEAAADALGTPAPRQRPRPDTAQGGTVGVGSSNPWSAAFKRDS